MKKPFWILCLLLVASYLLYRHLHRAPDAAETFEQILNLTPDQLQDRCGTPLQDTDGVVTDGDGIRDLRYRGADGEEIVFRFISGDGQSWESLGAWDQVSLPDDLGSPTESSDAAQRMPCAVQSASSAALLQRRILPRRGNSAREALATLLLTVFQEIPIPEPVPTPAPLPSPLPAPLPTPLPTPLPSPLPSPVPLPSPLPSPGPEPEPGPGPGPGPGPTASATPIVVPCPMDADPCQYINYAEFIGELKQAIEAEKENDFTRALQILTGDQVKIIQLPKFEPTRAQAVYQIFRLEVQAINVVEARLRDDLSRITPFPQDSPEVEQQKLDLVQRDDQQRRQIWKQAVNESRAPIVRSAPASGSNSEPQANGGNSESHENFRFQSEAYQQAVQIHLTGNWGN